MNTDVNAIIDILTLGLVAITGFGFVLALFPLVG